VVCTILLAIKFLISGLNSFRGIAKTFEILSSIESTDSTIEILSQQAPKFNTIRQWVLRLGLYELNRTKEYRTDWIFILDMTIEIGKNKCLVILGIPQKKLAIIIKQSARSLQHQDVEVLSVEILSPPTQRAKSRYHNIDILVAWAMKIISYEEKQYFSAVDNTYILDKEAYRALRLSISADTIKILKKAKPSAAENLDEFSQAMSNILTPQIWQIDREKICQAASLGRRKFYEKFGWLLSYRTDIQTYSEMLALISSVQTQIKNQGLHSLSRSQWIEALEQNSPRIITTPEGNPRVQKIQSQIEEYLVNEVQKIPARLTLLGTSDVVESLFGKYKIFAQRRPIKELGASILLIPLSTIEITVELVKEAMESISCIDVVAWTKSIFGSSMLSRRRHLNSPSNSDTEPA
jgi:hypothetical protein